ncbi:hypothetical protein [Niabella beijingensis]|uniref:hypothetical protein n=1 Tax=Niabella beijingensis TaxID=2872700 RepID=UPI001CBBC2D9|nr:hypothetical protein [Niabella beijingensis]MBZ4187635.1 hypothetical protein [Niabella beijingensis]
MANLLYRYINWNDRGSKRLLSENELFFYGADQWEKDGEYAFDLDGFSEMELFDIILKITDHLNNYHFDEYERWMNYNANKYGVDLSKLSIFQQDMMQQKFARKMAEEKVSNPAKFMELLKGVFFARTGIMSLSESKYSFNLWNSFRNEGSNNIICLGIDSDLLEGILANEGNCKKGKIKYSEETKKFELEFDPSGITNLNQLLTISFALKPRFQYEEEVRIQRLFIDNSRDSEERKIKLPDGIFKELIILKDADDATQSEVFALASQKNIENLQYVEILDDDSSVSMTII